MGTMQSSDGVGGMEGSSGLHSRYRSFFAAVVAPWRKYTKRSTALLHFPAVHRIHVDTSSEQGLGHHLGC
jgi:hypothetical protein